MKFVFFSGVDWNSCIGGRTRHLALELHRQGHTVHFICMPSLRRWKIGIQPDSGIFVYTLLPKSDRLGTAAGAAYLERKIGLTDAHVIVSHPAWHKLLEKLPHASLIYDCLDDIAVHAPGGRNYKRLFNAEQELLKQADLILVVSTRLKERLQFSRCQVLPNAVPAALTELRFPLPEKAVIGFHGALYEWIDYDLLEEIASEFANCTLYLAGTVRNPADLQRLKQKKNIVIHPEFRFEKMPEIVGNFSVGIVPFLNNEVGRCSDPLKTYEYLALGRPVVSTVSSSVTSPGVPSSETRRFLYGTSHFIVRYSRSGILPEGGWRTHLERPGKTTGSIGLSNGGA